jgi:hypothetical protein
MRPDTTESDDLPMELADERATADEEIFAGRYDPAVAMYILLENYREVAKAKAMWKASVAETKDLKETYEELVDRQNSLFEGFEKQKRNQDSGQPMLKTLTDED